MTDHPTHPQVRLLDPAFYLDPHPHLRWLREHAPVYWDESADGGLWGFALHEDVLYASRNPDLFCSGRSSRPERGSWVPTFINLDDPEHKRRRGLINRGFTARRVLAHERQLRRTCDERIDAVSGRGECDFVADIARWVPMVMIGELLGVDPSDHELLLRWSDELLGSGRAAAIRDMDERRAFQHGIASEYGRYIQDVVEERRRRPRADLISIWARAELDGQPLSDEEIRQESLLLLIGGDETTRHVMSGGLEQLIRHPDQKRRLARDPAGLPAAIEEMVRWVSPVQNMNRTVTRDTELRGQKLREGDRVLLLYPSANRDARRFLLPGIFDSARSPNEHVGFGGYGTHHCLGANLARLELRVLFERVLARLPDIELATSEPLPLRASSFVVGIEAMPVRFTPGG